MLDGAHLYADIIEINPPLVFWLNLPIAWIARSTGIQDISTYRITMVVMSVASIGTCAWLLSKPWRRSELSANLAFLVALSTVLIALPAGYFGQREHLVVAFITPYLLACAATIRGERFGRGSNAMIGTAAAAALALKPHFLIVWVVVTAYGWRRGLRRVGTLDRTIVCMLLGYAAALMLLAPSYLRVVASLGGAYQQFASRSTFAILTQDSLPLSVLAALVAYLGFRQTVREKVLADILGLAAAGFLLAVLLQGKGFGYHYIPAIGMAILLLMVMLGRRADGSPPLMRATAVVCACLILAGAAWPFLNATTRRARGELSPIDASMFETAGRVRRLAVGQPIAVLSPRLADAFPLVLYSGTQWALRLPHLWCLRVSSARGSYRAEQWCARAVGEDLGRIHPSLVLVRRWSPHGPVDLAFDFMKKLEADAEFERQFNAYNLTDSTSGFLIYRRAAVRP